MVHRCLKCGAVCRGPTREEIMALSWWRRLLFYLREL